MITAIETEYRGYRFRSRLEARWAVAFDADPHLQSWEYEPEGYETPHGRYLPDFRVWWTRDDFSWVEVKPEGHRPTQRDELIYSALVQGTRAPLYLLRGLGPGYRFYLGHKIRESAQEFASPAAMVAARSARFEFGESGTPRTAPPTPAHAIRTDRR